MQVQTSPPGVVGVRPLLDDLGLSLGGGAYCRNTVYHRHTLSCSGSWQWTLPPRCWAPLPDRDCIAPQNDCPVTSQNHLCAMQELADVLSAHAADLEACTDSERACKMATLASLVRRRVFEALGRTRCALVDGSDRLF